MSEKQKPSEVCIGLSVEGDLLRLATVGRVGQKLTVINLGSLNLPHHEMAYAGEGEGFESEKERDPFSGLEGGTAMAGPDYSEVHDFLQAHYVKGASIAISFGEPTVRTEIFDISPKEKGAAVVQKIISEIERTHNVSVPKDMVGYQSFGENKVLAAALLETPPLLNTLTQPLGSDNKPTKVSLVNSNDVALANITRAHFRFRDEEVVHLVFVGKDETRFYVLKGGDLIFIAPPVQQGASKELVAMLNNRIELAAELAGYPKADKVVLAGSAEQIGLRDEILANNPYVVFHSLSKLRIGHPRGADFEDIHDFVLPISVAWQKLLPKQQQFYRINLVPSRIKQEQNTMQIAWHGFLLIILILLGIVGLTYLGIQNQTNISRERDELNRERAEIERQRAIVQEIDALEARSVDIVAAATTLDTLLINQERWSETLDSLSKATAKIGSIWASELKPDPEGGYTLIGFSRNRANVPNLAHSVGETQMRELLVEFISENKVFRYDMGLALPDEYPYSGSPAMQWHDTVKTYIGTASEGGLPTGGGGAP
jgi:Tfp pilus assembly protein PilN